VTRSKPQQPHGIVRLTAMHRLAIALGISALAAIALRPTVSMHVSVLVSWDVFVLCDLALAWTLITRTDETQTRLRAQRYDPGGYILFLLIVVAASASFIAIGFMVGSIAELPFGQRAIRLVLSIGALFLSWFLIHTAFAFHYAKLYYYLPSGHDEHHRGLKFPHDDEPDYMDFAYYSFVVGMTSQVSDVAVRSRPMRRLTLVHGILSFVYNIAILAMSINIIGGAI